MPIRPLYSRVVVRRVVAAEKSKGGIIIPDTAKEKSVEATVIATGNGKLLDDGTYRKLDVKVGDRVIVPKYGGAEVRVADEDFVVIHEDEILGVLDDAGDVPAAL